MEPKRRVDASDLIELVGLAFIAAFFYLIDWRGGLFVTGLFFLFIGYALGNSTNKKVTK